MLRVVGVVIVLVIFVYALVDVIRTDKHQTRGISKPAWIIVMIVLPLLGAILWFIFGRPYGKPRQSPYAAIPQPRTMTPNSSGTWKPDAATRPRMTA